MATNLIQGDDPGRQKHLLERVEPSYCPQAIVGDASRPDVRPDRRRCFSVVGSPGRDGFERRGAALDWRQEAG